MTDAQLEAHMSLDGTPARPFSVKADGEKWKVYHVAEERTAAGVFDDEYAAQSWCDFLNDCTGLRVMKEVADVAARMRKYAMYVFCGLTKGCYTKDELADVVVMYANELERCFRKTKGAADGYAQE